MKAYIFLYIFLSLTGCFLSAMEIATYSTDEFVPKLPNELIATCVQYALEDIDNLDELNELCSVNKVFQKTLQGHIKEGPYRNAFRIFCTPHNSMYSYTLSRQEVAQRFGWQEYFKAGQKAKKLIINFCNSDVTECIKSLAALSQDFPNIINYTWWQPALKEHRLSGLYSLLGYAIKESKYVLATALIKELNAIPNNCAINSQAYYFVGRTELQMVKILKDRELAENNWKELRKLLNLLIPKEAPCKIASPAKTEKKQKRENQWKKAIHTIFSPEGDILISCQEFIKISDSLEVMLINSRRESILHHYINNYLANMRENRGGERETLQGFSDLIKKNSHLINVKDVFGNTPLHTYLLRQVANEQRHRPYISDILTIFFKQKDINLTIKNSAGDDFFDTVIEMEQYFLVSLLFNLLAKPEYAHLKKPEILLHLDQKMPLIHLMHIVSGWCTKDQKNNYYLNKNSETLLMISTCLSLIETLLNDKQYCEQWLNYRHPKTHYSALLLQFKLIDKGYLCGDDSVEKCSLLLEKGFKIEEPEMKYLCSLICLNGVISKETQKRWLKIVKGYTPQEEFVALIRPYHKKHPTKKARKKCIQWIEKKLFKDCSKQPDLVIQVPQTSFLRKLSSFIKKILYLSSLFTYHTTYLRETILHLSRLYFP